MLSPLLCGAVLGIAVPIRVLFFLFPTPEGTCVAIKKTVQNDTTLNCDTVSQRRRLFTGSPPGQSLS